jgi:hypothetical protein
MNSSDAEDGVNGRLIAINLDGVADVVEAEHTGGKAKSDQSVGAKHSVEVATVMKADVDT